MPTIVRAEHLALETSRGSVYGPVTFASSAPITVVAGGSGSGKTSLLLTLTGRMRPTSGEASALGFKLPRSLRAVQKRAGIAGFHGVDDLEATATVADTLAERADWNASWWRLGRRLSAADVVAALAPVFGEPGAVDSVDQPAAGTLVRDLSELQEVLLQVALANLSEPALLALDRIDLIQADADRLAAWRRLAAIARRGTVLLVSVADVHPRALNALELGWSAIDLSLSESIAPEPAKLSTGAVRLEELLETQK